MVNCSQLDLLSSWLGLQIREEPEPPKGYSSLARKPWAAPFDSGIQEVWEHPILSPGRLASSSLTSAARLFPHQESEVQALSPCRWIDETQITVKKMAWQGVMNLLAIGSFSAFILGLYQAHLQSCCSLEKHLSSNEKTKKES